MALVFMFVAVSLAYEATSSDMKILLLDVITNSELKDPPPLWRDPIHDPITRPTGRSPGHPRRGEHRYRVIC